MSAPCEEVSLWRSVVTRKQVRLTMYTKRTVPVELEWGERVSSRFGAGPLRPSLFRSCSSLLQNSPQFLRAKMSIQRRANEAVCAVQVVCVQERGDSAPSLTCSRSRAHGRADTEQQNPYKLPGNLTETSHIFPSTLLLNSRPTSEMLRIAPLRTARRRPCARWYRPCHGAQSQRSQ